MGIRALDDSWALTSLTACKHVGSTRVDDVYFGSLGVEKCTIARATGRNMQSFSRPVKTKSVAKRFMELTAVVRTMMHHAIKHRASMYHMSK
jgi:hypothetical protein